MPKKTILFSAYAFFPDFGGLEQQIYLLGQEYLKLGYQVHVLTEKTSPDQKTRETIDGIEVFRTSYQPKRSLWAYLSLFYQLSRHILTHRQHYELIILRAALTFYPIVFGLWKKMGVLKTPTWVTADTGGENDEVIQLKHWPASAVLIQLCAAHDYLNSICQTNYQHYLELGLPENKLTRIPNGIDLTPFKTARYPKRVKNFLFLARLIKEKGIRELLTAFQQVHQHYPGAKLFIGGDGPERAFVEKFILEAGLETVIHYLGLVTPDQKEAFYALGECVVLPSYSEGFGLVYAEAAARKKIIIATDVADLKRNYGNALYYCQKQSVDSLCQTMTAVLKETNFSHVRYESILPRFDITQIAPAILATALPAHKASVVF